jgi:hypothetical protein
LIPIVFLLDKFADRSAYGPVKLIDGVPKMNPRTPNKRIKSNDDALAAFVARKTEIDPMLTRIQTLSDDHFGVAPDAVRWDHGAPLATTPSC